MQDFMPPAVRPENPQAFALATRAEAEMKARFALAAMRPREQMVVRERLLSDCRRPAFAEMAKYAKPLGDGKTVEGPSIRFVEATLRAMGNVLVQNDVVFEDDRTRSTRVTVTDLETNCGHERIVTVSKVVERRSVKPGQEVIATRTNARGEVVYLVAGSEDQIQIKEAALVSKALRTLGERIIPIDLRMEAIEVCEATLAKEDSSDPSAASKKLADGFAKIGVSAKALSAFVDGKGWSFDAMTPAQLQELRAIFAAVRDGELSWKDLAEDESSEKSNGQKSAQDVIRERMEAAKKKPDAHPKAPESPAATRADPPKAPYPAPSATSTAPEAAPPSASTTPYPAPSATSTAPDMAPPSASGSPETAPPATSTAPTTTDAERDGLLRTLFPEDGSQPIPLDFIASVQERQPKDLCTFGTVADLRSVVMSWSGPRGESWRAERAKAANGTTEKRSYTRTKILKSQAEALGQIPQNFILEAIGLKYAGPDGVVAFGSGFSLVTKDDAETVIDAWQKWKWHAEADPVGAEDAPQEAPAVPDTAPTESDQDDLANAWEDVKAAGIPPAFAKSAHGGDPSTADAAGLRSILAAWQGPRGESWRLAQAAQAGLL